MIRMLFIVILVLAVMLGGDWLFSHQGMMTILLGDYEIEISTALAAILVAVACMLFTIVMLLIWQVVHWPERRRARRRYRTLQRGLTHLTQGFTALALNDDTSAALALKKASAALPNEPLPQLLTSQLLQRQGNTEESRNILRTLLKHDATAMLATHTLIEQYMSRREWVEATTLAEAALKESPHDRWPLLTLIDLHAHRGEYGAMLELTEGWHFRSPLSRAERHHIAAIAHYLIARREKESHLQMQHLEQAVNYAPDFLPATVDYATRLLANDQIKSARKLLSRAWDKQPSVLLITPIIDSLGDSSERQRARLLNTFMHKPLRAVHHLLTAQEAIDRGAFEEAKPALEAAIALEETKHACQMMAQVERELRGSAAANQWMARAMNASSDERWICTRCGHAHEAWYSHCESCAAFDTLEYQRPEMRMSVEVTPA